MVPFTVLIGSFLVFMAIRRKASGGASDAAAWALALMLLVTASAHFTSMRAELVRMVPPFLPAPEFLVTFTGVLELLGALGLLVRRTRAATGVLLALLFLAMLPANIYAARAGLTMMGKPVTALWLRIPMQVLFIAFALYPAWSRWRARARQAAPKTGDALVS